MWLEIWSSFHTPNARRLTHHGFAHFGMRICEGAQPLSCFPYGGSHDHFAHFLGGFNWPKVFWGNKDGIFSCIPSFDCYNLKTREVIHACVVL